MALCWKVVSGSCTILCTVPFLTFQSVHHVKISMKAVVVDQAIRSSGSDAGRFHGHAFKDSLYARMTAS